MKKSIFILLAGTLLTVGGGILAPALSPIGKVQAQTGKFTVDGSVRDDKGMPVIGASVIVKGTNTGVTTDLDGNFTLAAPYSEATLTVSYLGYAPQEIPINNRTHLDIVLVEDAKALENVVVVGYTTQKKATITGSVSTITTRELGQSPTANINNALAGRLPGLVVTQHGGGEPGFDVANVNIRGVATYGNGKEPIVIVDGIERDMSYLSADEIETFTILKDASATAPYGIRGANGVIIITTKRGRAGEKPTVEFKASAGITEPVKFPKYLGSADYAVLYNEALINDNPGADISRLSLFTGEAIANYRRAAGDNSDGLGYDWDYFDFMFQPAVTQDYSLSVRGGTDRVRYYVLGSYYKQGDNYAHSAPERKNGFSRYNFRSNIDIQATKRFRISVDLGARVRQTTYPGASASSLIGLANTQPSYLPIWIDDTGLEENAEDFLNNGGRLLYCDDQMYRYNVLGQLTRTGYTVRTDRDINGSIRLAHDLDFITKGLRIEGQFSYDSYDGHNKQNKRNTFSQGNLTFPGYSTWKLKDESIDVWKNQAGHFARNGVFETANDRTVDDNYARSLGHYTPYATTRFQGKLDYSRKFGDHDVTAMLLGYFQNRDYGNDVEFRYCGMSARMTYGFRNKYLLDLNVGYNGSEAFASGKRFGFFPAASLGWVLSNENFLKHSGAVNFLKIRGSVGLAGNDNIGSTRFAYIQTYNKNTSYTTYFGETLTGFGSSYDEGAFANTNLTWEKALKYNVGIDAKLFANRLSLTLDLFYEHRYDILTDLSSASRMGLPALVGQKATFVNSGIVNNKGIEVELGWSDHIGNDFTYYIKPNVSFARNNIKFCNEISYVSPNGVDCTWRYETGHRVGEHFCYQFDHFVRNQEEADALNKAGYQTFGKLVPGDVVYKDLNGDGIIDNYDRAAMGNPRIPEIQFGLPLGFRYKNFDFSMLWQGSALCSVQLSGAAVWDFPVYNVTAIGKVKQMHLNRWTPQTADTAEYPALHLGAHSNNKNANSGLFLYDASYVRLKNLEIGYSLPKRWLSKVNIQNVRVYAQGLNLLTFDSLGDVDMDPETKSGDGSWYPIQRVFNFGITMTF